MKREIASFFFASASAFVVLTRIVSFLIEVTSLPRATMRISPLANCSSPKGGDDNPMLTCPVIAWVNVAETLPVETGLAFFRPNCRMKRSTMLWVEEPLVEYAMVLPSASLIDWIGDFAGTNQ